MTISNKLATLYRRFRNRKSAAGDSHSKEGTLSGDNSQDGQAKSGRLSPDHNEKTQPIDRNLHTESKYGRVEDPSVPPWPAVCYLRVSFGSEADAVEGSGFLFSESMVITAAHNLCALNEEGKRVRPTKILVKLGNSNATYPAKRAKDDPRYADCRIDTKYADFLEQIWKDEPTASDAAIAELGEFKSYHDYGAVLLADEIKLVPPFFFQVHGIAPRDPCWDRPLFCSGYPAPSHLLHYSVGAASSHEDGRFIGDESNLVKHDARVVVGQSGGPLYVPNGKGQFVVVGIQSGSLQDINRAVRITTQMEGLFRSWDKENGKDRQIDKGRDDLIA